MPAPPVPFGVPAQFRGQTLSTYQPTFREAATDWMRRALYSDDRARQRKAEKLSNVLETVTPFGFATGIDDMKEAVGQGDYATAGMMGAMAMVPGPSPKKYSYAMMYRPPNTATLPKGFRSIGPATSEHKFGTVDYDTPISSADLDRYEMVPLDPNHPRNLKKSFEDFKTRFADDFSNAGERYKSKDGQFAITPNLSGDGWQVTDFSNTGVPMGHEVITDFDDVAMWVWSHERSGVK